MPTFLFVFKMKIIILIVINAITALPMMRVLSVFAGMAPPAVPITIKPTETTKNSYLNDCSKIKCPPIYTKPDLLSKSLSDLYFPSSRMDIPAINNGTVIDVLSILKGNGEFPVIAEINNATDFNSSSKPPVIPKSIKRSHGAIRFM
jgi:hypothetical protein